MNWDSANPLEGNRRMNRNINALSSDGSHNISRKHVFGLELLCFDEVHDLITSTFDIQACDDVDKVIYIHDDHDDHDPSRTIDMVKYEARASVKPYHESEATSICVSHDVVEAPVRQKLVFSSDMTMMLLQCDSLYKAHLPEHGEIEEPFELVLSSMIELQFAEQIPKNALENMTKTKK